ncbi:hypothetical protein ACP4OV_013644 [Aristida adscensionis]
MQQPLHHPIWNTSSRIKQVSQELRRLASVNRHATDPRIDRSKSTTAHALKGTSSSATPAVALDGPPSRSASMSSPKTASSTAPSSPSESE